MEFRLPSNLQSELLAYDPKFKQLHQEQNPKVTKAKPKFPLGAVFDLIPTDVIRPTAIEDAVTSINSRGVEQRHHRFTRVVNIATPEVRTITHAVIYHYEKVWYAAWLPPKGHEDDYVYGYAYAYKNLDSVRKSIPHTLVDNNSKRTVEYVKYGRSEFCVVRQNVTKEDIINGQTTNWWRCMYISYGKGQWIRAAINAFESTLSETIPKWHDSPGFFDRITNNNWTNILRLKEHARYWNQFDDAAQAKRDLLPSADLIYNLAAAYSDSNSVNYHEPDYIRTNRIMHIIGKPFFRKWIQSQCDEAIAMFNDPDNNLFCKLTQPWKRIERLVQSIDYVNKIWPDCPIDYYQTHTTDLLGVRLDRYLPERTITWLRTNMQPASFFNILKQHYTLQFYSTTERDRIRYSTPADTGIVTFSFAEWNDTLSMLDNVLENGMPVTAPKRWRLTEFHDHVQVEAWKIKNPNVSLSQDLFPVPVKVEVGDERWSFFQPHGTHQLSAWGEAVRNCVGDVKEYAEGVRKKKHFIVLCMVDNKPQFTVQLKVDMGMMSVSQIVGMSNRRLTDEQKDAYTQAFSKALHCRNDELESA
jgi:hypothetical protein